MKFIPAFSLDFFLTSFVNLQGMDQGLEVMRHVDNNNYADWNTNSDNGFDYTMPEGLNMHIPWVRLNTDGIVRADLIGQYFKNY
ncbi:MAG: hypothetical protein ACJAZ2_001642 [Glaciecola sp.]|jgi:hypothetical protein